MRKRFAFDFLADVGSPYGSPDWTKNYFMEEIAEDKQGQICQVAEGIEKLLEE